MEHKLRLIDRAVRSALLGAISMCFAFSASGWDGHHATPVVQPIGEVTGKTADAVCDRAGAVPLSRRMSRGMRNLQSLDVARRTAVLLEG